MIASCVRRLGLSVCFVMLAGFNAVATPTDAEARRDAQHRINISGRQRMLSQRIAKAACFAALKPGSGGTIQEMKDARALFLSTMQALKSGSVEMRLAPERDADVLSAVDTAAQLAQDYVLAVDEFEPALSSTALPEKLEKIYELNLPALVSINDAVELLESKHKDGRLIRRGLANAINVAGRQRMLSQKMSKELCMIASGFMPQVTRAHLLGTLALFTSAHEELKRGLVQMNLNEKDASAISRQFEEIERRWHELRPIFSGVAGGRVPAETDVSTVTAKNVPFLVELNRAVELYEKIDTAEVAPR
jgi:nitrate/nitrite-specific signal transduction histidine kinase